MTTAPNGELRRQDFHLQVQQLVSLRALRKWVYRFAQQGPQGLIDRPRSGRPRKVTCALEQHLHRLVDEDPLHHGSIYSQWSCRALATVLAHQTGIQIGRESVRGVLKKRRQLQPSHGAARPYPG
jgi:transposase